MSNNKQLVTFGLLLIGLLLGLAGAAPVMARSDINSLYTSSCAVCHGVDGTGDIPGTPDFTAKTGPLAKADHALHLNISNGYQTPGNAMAMPAKGGNPNLSEQDITALISFMKQEFYLN